MASDTQTGHQRFSEDLALYALGALDAAAIAALEQHLESCNSCRRELAELCGGAALLALSASGPTPPARSRRRLLEAIAQEPVRRPAPKTPQGRWWFWIPAFAVLVLAVFSGILWQSYIHLKDDNQALNNRLNRAEREAAEAQDVMTLIRAKDAKPFTLVRVNAPRDPNVKTIYQQHTGRLLLIASNLAPIPAGKVYELWLLPPKGAPVPAGLFLPDGNGNAILEPKAGQLPAGAEAKAFAVTVENDGGSQTPTLPIVLMGTGE